MALYHFHASILKRSSGHSAVASAAYRAGQRIYDSRIGHAFDYRRRFGILHTEILAPENTPDWMLDRYQLWNGVEKAEKRKDSQLARNIDISLMCELSFEQNLELLRDFVNKTWVAQGMIADIAVHKPGRDSDQRNIHAHILLTMRVITSDGFGNKQRDWNDKDEYNQWRESWASYANAALDRAGFAERIDHRSLAEQGIGREPTIHVGPSGMQIEHRNKNSDRAQQNRDIKAVNDNIELLKKELAESDKRLADLRRQQAAERMEQIQRTVRAVDAAYDKAEQGGRQAPAPERPPEPEPPALAKQPEPRAPTPRRTRPSAAERIQQSQKIVEAVDAAYEKTKQRQDTAPPLQPPALPPYPENSPPPVSAGGKAVSMPDDLSEAQKQEAKRQTEEQTKEQAREDKAAEDEQARQKQAAADQEKGLENMRQLNKRIDDLAKEQEALLAAQAEEMRQAQLRRDADREQKARIDAYRAGQEKIAADDRRREERERQARLEAQHKEGPIRDAGERYGQALSQHYNFGNPYASLAKVAMEEYAAFRKDRETLDQQIAKTADPQERQALDLRKRIEGAEYIVMTSERIAQQSVVITGRRDSEEAVKFRKRASDYQIQAQDLRQQLRELRQENAQEKDQERDRTEAKPELEIVQRPGTLQPNRYAPLVAKMDDAAREREEAAKTAQEREAEKDPERQTQQQKERDLQRKRDRER